jgi:hypothetical protein
MKKIDLNSWYVYNNKLDIYVNNIYANIEITPNEDDLCQLKVIDNSFNNVQFSFKTLEEAISFTESIVYRCMNDKQIIEEYNKLYPKDSDKVKVLKLKSY